MTTQTLPLPLVYATPHALELALAVLPAGQVLETEVARAIDAGRATHRPMPNRELGAVERNVWSGRGWVAEIRRTTAPSGRKAWLVTHVDRDPATVDDAER